MTRRSLYLVPTTPNTSTHLAATITTSLLSLAEQASTFAFTLVRACVPGVRQAPRAGVKVPSSPAIDGAQVEDAKRRRRVIADVEELSNIVEVLDAPHIENAATAPEFRAALVNRVRHFTTTRISRLSSPVVAVPAPPAPSPLDEDPFSSPLYPTFTKSNTRPNPETLHVLALARTQVLSVRGTQNSPTPALRHTNRGDRRRPAASGLRQHTVFFQPQPQSPTQKQTPPKFWQPHPAGKRSCAVPIKAPVGKENCSAF
ncbi:hypothetical protein HMN09_00092200 [Mycena chlorophos]|uniref:Uncharacterized protein n=1 Tax=Mycena chlorophos TaxID=658473 RepID=A0A8H6TQ08_MYCCL|nr:hypothetical protein HMN09_00092200 [Mycena chlorophos]